MKEEKKMATMSGTQMPEQRMTSLDIAQVTGKTHAHVLRDIRNMEPAWEKECGAKFGRTSEKIQMPQGGEKKERKYLVWTPMGMEFVRTVLS
jgi:phage regulator Rha-like protein